MSEQTIELIIIGVISIVGIISFAWIIVTAMKNGYGSDDNVFSRERPETRLDTDDEEEVGSEHDNDSSRHGKDW